MPNLVLTPKPLSEKQINDKIADTPLTMCFDYRDPKTGNGSSIQFVYHKQHTGFVIKLFGIFASHINKKLIAKFRKTYEIFSKTQMPVFTYRYRAAPIPDSSSTENEPYYIHDPRVIEQSNPYQIYNISELFNIFESKTVLFYTGAGISAGIVPMMSELLNMLGLTECKNIPALTHTIKTAVLHPESYTAKMQSFYEKCLYSKPTVGHQLLSLFALHKKTSILTENLDLLHQHTGYEAILPSTKLMKNPETIASLQKIDAVVCIGLSHDDRGFLGWYKHCNPKGQIVSLNLNPASTNYLGNDDCHMTGNAQRTLLQVLNLAYAKRSLVNEGKLRTPKYDI